MKRIFVSFLTLFISVAAALAQEVKVSETAEDKIPFSIKSYAFRGTYLDSGTHWEKFGGAYPAGVNLGFEFPSQQQHPWQRSVQQKVCVR